MDPLHTDAFQGFLAFKKMSYASAATTKATPQSSVPRQSEFATINQRNIADGKVSVPKPIFEPATPKSKDDFIRRQAARYRVNPDEFKARANITQNAAGEYITDMRDDRNYRYLMPKVDPRVTTQQADRNVRMNNHTAEIANAGYLKNLGRGISYQTNQFARGVRDMGRTGANIAGSMIDYTPFSALDMEGAGGAPRSERDAVWASNYDPSGRRAQMGYYSGMATAGAAGAALGGKALLGRAAAGAPAKGFIPGAARQVGGLFNPVYGAQRGAGFMGNLNRIYNPFRRVAPEGARVGKFLTSQGGQAFTALGNIAAVPVLAGAVGQQYKTHRDVRDRPLNEQAYKDIQQTYSQNHHGGVPQGNVPMPQARPMSFAEMNFMSNPQWGSISGAHNLDPSYAAYQDQQANTLRTQTGMFPYLLNSGLPQRFIRPTYQHAAPMTPTYHTPGDNLMANAYNLPRRTLSQATSS